MSVSHIDKLHKISTKMKKYDKIWDKISENSTKISTKVKNLVEKSDKMLLPDLSEWEIGMKNNLFCMFSQNFGSQTSDCRFSKAKFSTHQMNFRAFLQNSEVKKEINVCLFV